MKPCRPEHGDYRDGCRICFLARTSERYARHWGEPWDGSPAPPAGKVERSTGVRPAARPLPVTRAPCRHEGEVVNPAACGCAAKGVRFCLHPAEPEWTRCTRGPNAGADPDVASCSACPLHEPL